MFEKNKNLDIEKIQFEIDIMSAEYHLILNTLNLIYDLEVKWDSKNHGEKIAKILDTSKPKEYSLEEMQENLMKEKQQLKKKVQNF